MNNSYFIRRDHCPVCQAPVAPPLYACPFDQSPVADYLTNAYRVVGPGVEWEFLRGEQYTLAQCPGCSLVYQITIPNTALMSVLYERWIDPQTTFARHEQADNLRRHALYAQDIMQFIAHFRQPTAELRVLDFGMGWGKWARLARAFGCTVSGTELSNARIKYAASQGINVIASGDIPPLHFDYINADQVFEHLPEPLVTLRQLAVALKPAGLIRISVPDGEDIKRRLRRLDWLAPKGSRHSLEPVAPLEHINCFNRAALLALASRAGLQLVTFPISLQLTCTANWGAFRSVARNLLVPFHHDLLGKGTNILLRPQ